MTARQFRFVIRSRDYDASVRLWGQSLGLTRVDEWDRPDGRGTIFSGGGNALVEVVGLPDDVEIDLSPTSTVYLGMEVDDVDAWHTRAANAGLEVDGPPVVKPWGHRSFRVKEPSGVDVYFFTIVDGDTAESS